ncbi:flagellar hook-associated protein FlgK [Pararhodobacter oceanensis]|uniref:flagellar hook-associated protein FlgK n=1 Tax=Pararhodobacter oceanensis TaxID=2172121 RepID=UPI003A8D3538
MSISSALYNAASGLTASARAVQVVSSNVANAMTEGYAARQLELSASSLGGVGQGVRIAGVTRRVDPILLDLTRAAQAGSQASSARAGFWQSFEAQIGQPGAGLSQALAGFDSALVEASDRPDLDSRLSAVVTSASQLAAKLNGISASVQVQRGNADAAIARDVETLNAGLAQIDTLNASIVKTRAAGQSTLGLEDERQAIISTLSEIVPIREYPRDNGRVTLYTAGGQLLLDLEPQKLGFSAASTMSAGQTVATGLSGLTVNGHPVDTGPNGAFKGGRLAANFAIRDEDGVRAQTDLDLLASDLISRFEDPATDPTLTAGAPGLFTDAGAALTNPAPVGLAARVSVNDLILPDGHNELWRVRDGLGAAATPGAVGDASQIHNLIDALERSIAPAPGSAQQNFASTLGSFSAETSQHRHQFEVTATHSATHASELTEQMLAQGVDTDAEMQRLLQIEQAYAANAQVISTADAMLRRLLEI